MATDRRQRKKQLTRSSIQAAAIDLFAERGYGETTVAAVADAADVAVRTVSGHFPTKQDLVFADEPFTPTSLGEWLGEHDRDTVLDAFRAWMETTMTELTEERRGEFWRRRLLRARLILENPELRARARGSNYELEIVLAGAVAAERQEATDAIAPRLVAATVVSGVREVYASYEAEDSATVPSPEELLALIDRVLAFARSGLRAL